MATAKAIFQSIAAALDTQGEELVSSFKGTALFVVDGVKYYLDLSQGSGSVKEEDEIKDFKADLTVTVGEETFLKLAAGKVNAQMAFMTGKLKLKGNIGLAMKLPELFKAVAGKPKL